MTCSIDWLQYLRIKKKYLIMLFCSVQCGWLLWSFGYTYHNFSHHLVGKFLPISLISWLAERIWHSDLFLPWNVHFFYFWVQQRIKPSRSSDYKNEVQIQRLFKDHTQKISECSKKFKTELVHFFPF